MHRFRLPKQLASGALAAALALTPAMAFTDTEAHWAADAINKWSQQYGVLQGYEDGSFRPDASITRGAFAGILDRFLRFQEISGSETFSDTAGTYWESSILKLNAAGVYLGNGGLALPGDTITRQQAMSMVARAFHVEASVLDLGYEDEAQIAQYARPYIAEMTARGWLNDVKENRFRPTDPLTRAELVNLLNNMIQVLVQETETYSSDVDGSLLINAPGGASLADMTIHGDLILAPGVTGDVKLTNVTIEGGIRNFSSVTPMISTPPASGQDPDGSTEPGDPTPPAESDPPADPNPPSDPGIVVVPITPADPEKPVNPENPDTPGTPGIQPSDIYTPGATTGEFVQYGGKKVPVYAGVQPSRLKQGDFQWNGNRLEYVGGDFRTRFGIDVSAYQNRASKNETIDWQAVAADGVEFVMVRIGLRGTSTGKVNEDAFYRQNIQGAMNAGIETGVYFFAQAITVEEAIEEAEFVIEHLRDLNINGPVAYDWEISSKYRVNDTSPEMATACAVAFCRRIAEAGYTPMIYQGSQVGYLKYDQAAVSQYLTWFPEYKSASSEKLYPTFYYQMNYWQFSSKCSVAGIGGNVDANIQFIPW